MAVNAWVPLATKTLTAPTSFINFTEISQSYRDLILVINASTASSSNITLNASGASQHLRGNGTNLAASVNALGYPTYLAAQTTMIYTAGSLAQVIATFYDYSSTTKIKTYVAKTTISTGSGITVGYLNQTAGITSLLLFPSSNFTIGSTFTLYGIAA